MRKTFLTESLARLLRGAIGIACLTAACVSCETHSNSDRSESIAVYADPIEKKPVDAVYVGVQGGQAKIYAEATSSPRGRTTPTCPGRQSWTTLRSTR